jgi:trimeric autotransporter adhesin
MKKLLPSSFNMKHALLCFISLLLLTPINAQNIIDFAGNGNMGYSGDGFPANSGYCELYQPAGVYIDKFGNTYIDDCLNNVIRKVNTNGIISTFAGIKITGYGGYSGDGGPATNAELNLPEDVCGDTAGNIFIADYDNSVIRMVNTAGIISTVVGSGFIGYSGDGGPATNAELDLPVYVFVDNQESIYISDLGNFRIRKVNASGIISTFAGNGIAGYNGDGGPATSAELRAGVGVCNDSTGNIYIAMGTGVIPVIRKVNRSGIISTIAGNGIAGYSGDGGPATSAELSYPFGLCFDASGNLLFCDGGNNRVREINTSGIISTVAGNGDGGRSGDGGPATTAELYNPWGIAVNQYGNVCFSEANNNDVREIVYHPVGIENITDDENIFIYPNPANQKINLQFNKQLNGLATLTIMDITGREVLSCEKNISNGIVQVDVSYLTTGMYFLSLKNKDVSIIKKFIKQ